MGELGRDSPTTRPGDLLRLFGVVARSSVSTSTSKILDVVAHLLLFQAIAEQDEGL
jgi:hypothetical protein